MIHMCDGWSCGTEPKMWNGWLGWKQSDRSRWSDGSNQMGVDGQTEVIGWKQMVRTEGNGDGWKQV